MPSTTCSIPPRSCAPAAWIGSCSSNRRATGSADGSGRWSWTGSRARSTTSGRACCGKRDRLRCGTARAGAAGRRPEQPGSTARGGSARAVENRYPIEDFQRFFAGFGLDVRGTAAGFDRYPPDPYGRPPMREAFGRAHLRRARRRRGRAARARPGPARQALGDLRRARRPRSTAHAGAAPPRRRSAAAAGRARRGIRGVRRARRSRRRTARCCARSRCATPAGGRSSPPYSRAITGWTPRAPSSCRTARGRRCPGRSRRARRAR